MNPVTVAYLCGEMLQCLDEVMELPTEFIEDTCTCLVALET